MWVGWGGVTKGGEGWRTCKHVRQIYSREGNKALKVNYRQGGIVSQHPGRLGDRQDREYARITTTVAQDLIAGSYRGQQSSKREKVNRLAMMLRSRLGLKGFRPALGASGRPSSSRTNRRQPPGSSPGS